STAFGVRMVGTASSSDFYYVQVERGPAAEREPNNTPVEAQSLGSLAAGDVLTEMGNAHSSDQDWFSFTLDASFGSDDGIWVSWENLVDTGALMVELYDVTDAGNP